MNRHQIYLFVRFGRMIRCISAKPSFRDLSGKGCGFVGNCISLSLEKRTYDTRPNIKFNEPRLKPRKNHDYLEGWLGHYVFLGSATTEPMSKKKGFVAYIIYRGPGFEWMNSLGCDTSGINHEQALKVILYIHICSLKIDDYSPITRDPTNATAPPLLTTCKHS